MHSFQLDMHHTAPEGASKTVIFDTSILALVNFGKDRASCDDLCTELSHMFTRGEYKQGLEHLRGYKS